MRNLCDRLGWGMFFLQMDIEDALSRFGLYLWLFAAGVLVAFSVQFIMEGEATYPPYLFLLMFIAYAVPTYQRRRTLQSAVIGGLVGATGNALGFFLIWLVF